MARVVCQCGESFAPFMLNGEPRKSCPFCRRELTVGTDGMLVGATPAPQPPPPARAAEPSALAPASIVTASVAAEPLRNTSPATHLAGIVAASPSPASLVQPLQRFVNAGVLEAAVRELSQFVEAEMAKRKHPLACPLGMGCVPAECSRAFACQALPSIGSGRGYILKWTLGAAGAMIAFLAILFAILAFVAPAANRPREPNYPALAALVLGFPAGAGVLGFAYAFLASRWQQGHVRALAAAAHKTGLHFLPLVQVPAKIADAAFPVICPTPPKFGLHVADSRAIVKLAGSGAIDGRRVHLAQYMFHFDPHDHVPLGGAIKVAQTIVKPGTAFSRPETWRMYVLAYFPEVLSHVPDFLVMPAGRDFETHFVRREFSTRLISLPNQGCLGEYLLAMADPSKTAMLGVELFELLARSRGWSIQVVGGRLAVWKGGCHPDVRFQLPQSGGQVIELIEFSSRVRQILSRTAGSFS